MHDDPYRAAAGAYDLFAAPYRAAQQAALAEETGLLIKTAASGEPDLTTADGRATMFTLAAWDQAEAERTAERTRAAARSHAEQGRYNGPRPYGWRFATNEHGEVLRGHEQRLVIDQDEAAVIRECVDRVLAGDSLWKIKNNLNKRGITTATGGEWHTQTLRRMLLRPMLTGIRKHQPYRNGKWVGLETQHEGQWKPILDQPTHDRVVAKLTDPARISNHGNTEVKYLLTWLIDCGKCGKPLVAAKGGLYPE